MNPQITNLFSEGAPPAEKIGEFIQNNRFPLAEPGHVTFVFQGQADEVNLRVRSAVDGLPEQQRLALVLSRFHGCSYDEIAETLKTTIPAVKSLLTRARANLRTALGDLVERMPDPARAEGNS